MASISILGWDSRPYEGPIEELGGASSSEADGSMFLAKSVGTGLGLAKVHIFSPLDPSLSSSASFDDKPYGNWF
jgi:hypothetical protein